MSTCHTQLRRPPAPARTRADASAATEGVAGFWGPLALFGVLLQHFRGALGWRSSGGLTARARSPPMAPLCSRAPRGIASPGAWREGLWCRQAWGGCDHICGDTCADYGKWVNLPAAGGSLAGGGVGGELGGGVARGRAQRGAACARPSLRCPRLSHGCRAVTGERGSGTRLHALLQPARLWHGGSWCPRPRVVRLPRLCQVLVLPVRLPAPRSLPRPGARCHHIPVSGGVERLPAR